MDAENKKIIALMGPTAVGKTKVAIEAARRFGGEIVGADSMQVYRHMRIGSAAPTDDELSAAAHHIVGIVDPSDEFSVADWLARAEKAIAQIIEKGKLPIVAGGTGLYFKALFDGLFDAPSHDPELRAKIKARAESENLYPELERIDPEAAKKIHPNDIYRTTRALEVYYQTGSPISEHWRNQARPDRYRTLRIGLDVPRPALHEKINLRSRKMIEAGLVDEVKQLKRLGYSRDLWPMRHFGYKHVWAHIEGEIDLDAAVELLARDTRRFARRQLTWFRAVPEISWFDPEKDAENIYRKISDFIGA